MPLRHRRQFLSCLVEDGNIWVRRCRGVLSVGGYFRLLTWLFNEVSASASSSLQLNSLSYRTTHLPTESRSLSKASRRKKIGG
jgi:hypothetical protein